MARSTRKLDALAELLERTGGDPKRLAAVRQAQGFRRSWIELAKILAEVRNDARYEAWGFSDFYTYCKEELTLNRATVDKLTVSFHTLEQRAPQVLSHDGIARTIPSYQAIDYFEKAMSSKEEGAANGPKEAPRRKSKPDAVTKEFETAVFEEGAPVAELRRRFDEQFFPKSDEDRELDLLRKASAAARKLADLLAEVPGVPKKQSRQLVAELGALRTKLDELAAPRREQKIAAKKASAGKTARRTKAKAESGKATKAKPKAKAKARASR